MKNYDKKLKEAIEKTVNNSLEFNISTYQEGDFKLSKYTFSITGVCGYDDEVFEFFKELKTDVNKIYKETQQR